jgi:hypothetical protein
MRVRTRWIAGLGLVALAACGETVTQPEAVGCGEGCPIKTGVAPDPGTVPNPATITGH